MKKILLTLFVAFFVFLTYAAAAYQAAFLYGWLLRDCRYQRDMPTL